MELSLHKIATQCPPASFAPALIITQACVLPTKCVHSNSQQIQTSQPSTHNFSPHPQSTETLREHLTPEHPTLILLRFSPPCSAALHPPPPS
jgi:hypothetical protein